MPITLNLQHNVQTQAQPTARTMDVAVMFGLSLDGTRDHTIIPPIELKLTPGQVVFVTGVSGGGKSTLLRLISQAVADQQSDASTPSPALIWSDQLPGLSAEALVDALAQPEATADTTTPPATLCLLYTSPSPRD